MKRTVARETPRKRSTKRRNSYGSSDSGAKLKRGATKARKKVRATKPPSTPVVETVVVDVVEEPVRGVTVVTEFEAMEVREAPRQSEEGQGPAPPESEEP